MAYRASGCECACVRSSASACECVRVRASACECMRVRAIRPGHMGRGHAAIIDTGLIHMRLVCVHLCRFLRNIDATSGRPSCKLSLPALLTVHQSSLCLRVMPCAGCRRLALHVAHVLQLLLFAFLGLMTTLPAPYAQPLENSGGCNRSSVRNRPRLNRGGLGRHHLSRVPGNGVG